MNRLPPASPLLVAETLDALPARLRRRLDTASAEDWRLDGDRAVFPDDVVVTLQPVLRETGDITCTCLLAPTCLHRARVLLAAPVAGSDESAEVPAVAGVEASAAADWTSDERAGAEAVFAVAADILALGLNAVGVANESALLRAVHGARLAGLHRLAAAATRVATGVRAGRLDSQEFSTAALTRDLTETLEVSAAVMRSAPASEGWRGRSRSSYEPVGGLSLQGLCTEPVVTSSGYAGVVVWLVDPAEGRVWSVSDVRPGDPDRVWAAASGPVAVGESGVSHRVLGRSELTISGATANPDGRLGAGRRVRAISKPGPGWAAEPLAGLFDRHITGPDGLQLVTFTVVGSLGGRLLGVDGTGAPLRFDVPGGRVFIDNLTLLAATPGLRLQAVVRATDDDGLLLLAVGGEALTLPVELAGHIDLGLDRLSAGWLRPGDPPPTPPTSDDQTPLADLTLLRERMVAGGRRSLTVPGAAKTAAASAARLRQAQLRTAAELLETLTADAQFGERDVFGRTSFTDNRPLAQAWLVAGVYLREVQRAFGCPPRPAGPDRGRKPEQACGARRI